MLHTLPNEVLKVITEQLSFSDKLNLCKTCRKLHEKISRINLYRTVKVRKNTEDVMRMFQDKILDGTHVQVLDIIMDDLSDELYSNLADIFSNLIRVKTDGAQNGTYIQEEKEREDHIIRPLLKWKVSLKKYDSNNDWRHFRNEMFHSIFPQLEDLTFCSSVSFTGRKNGFDPLFLSKGIINAPMLTSLSLDDCDISIDSLEVIHHGCLYIRSLEFDSTILIVDNDTLPLSIVTANSVSHLKIHLVCLDRYGMFLDYIVCKYPNLQVLDFTICNTNIYSPHYHIGIYYPNHWRNISENDGEHEQIFRNRMNLLEPTLKAYKDSGSTFLSRLPKSIKSLRLQLHIFDDATEVLSKKNTALSILSLVSEDASGSDISINSDQLGHIKYLNKLRFLKVHINMSVQSLETDVISNTITALEIVAIDREININWILSMFPSLETLRVESYGFLFIEEIESGRTSVGKVYPKLRKLDFWDWYSSSRCSGSPNCLNYLKTIVPNVEEFSYRTSIDKINDGESTYSFDFTGWNLTKLDILADGSCYANYYMVILSPKGKQQFFRDDKEETFFPLKNRLEFEKDGLILNVTCDYIKDCSINGLKFDL